MSSKIHPCLEASSRLLSTLSHYDAAADGMLRATSTGMGTDADEALRLIGSSMISARSAMLATRDFFVHLSDCTRFFADPCIQASTAVFSHALDTSSGPIPSSVLHDAIRDWHRLLWLHAYDRNEACKDALSSMLESVRFFSIIFAGQWKAPDWYWSFFQNRFLASLPQKFDLHQRRGPSLSRRAYWRTT